MTIKKPKTKDPLHRKRQPHILCDVVDGEVAQKWFEEERNRTDEEYFPQLFAFYEIDNGAYKELTRAMAREFFSGFQYPELPAHKQRDLKKAATLVGWIYKKMYEGEMNLSSALLALIQEGEKYHREDSDVESLRKQYQRSRKYLIDAGYRDDDLLGEECRLALECDLAKPELRDKLRRLLGDT